VGVCVGLIILLSCQAAYIAVNCGIDKEFTNTIEFRSMVNIPAGYLVLFPLSTLRDLSALSFAAMLSICAVTYTTIVLLIELPYYNTLNYPKADIKVAVLDWNFLSSAAVVFFSYTC
jgi:amino acid permease